MQWKADIYREKDMETRPELHTGLSKAQFLQYYYLLEELKGFCRKEGLMTTGSKSEITKRIAHYLETGEKLTSPVRKSPAGKLIENITRDTKIEKNIRCSQIHRAFFEAEIGPKFHFYVAFQKWLKANAGKTYADAILAYNELQTKSKHQKTNIDRQFEYNTYIRDFFAANQGLSLEQAIRCWKYKKGLPGSNHYEEADLDVLKKQDEN